MEPPSPYRISILQDSGELAPTADLERAVLHVLSHFGFSSGELSIRLADDAAIRDLNRDFRGIDATTDVLTFPPPELPGMGEGDRPLGDLAISVPQACRQAERRGYRLEHELAYLAIHGVLHLAGFEDELEADRDRMVREMALHGAACGLPPLGDWHTMEPTGALR